MAEQTIPTFDLADLQAGRSGDDFRRCLKDLGAFYLTGHAVPATSHQLAVDAAMDFFLNASEQDKERVTNKVRGIRRGYSRLEAESTAQVTSTGTFTDYSMAYSMGLTGNLFSSPELEAAFTDYFDRLYGLAKATARTVLTAARAHCEGGIEAFLECDPIFRLRYFPEVPEDRCAELEPLRMATHYDLSVVTLIQQTPCSNGFVSLHCDTADRRIAIPPRTDAIVVLCGAVATIVSEGRIHAPLHQVVSPTREFRKGSGRTSSVFFLRPKSDFSFSVPRARDLGLDVSAPGPSATFEQWIGGNYESMHTASSPA